MRLIPLIVGLLATLVPSSASTLVRLSLDEMIVKSTEIVRGRIADNRSVARGPVVYTIVQVDVVERWKGSRANRVEVAIPGGQLGEVHQTFSGTPTLKSDKDYILFLWTGTNGVTQVIGLSQGVLTVSIGADGQQTVTRPVSDAVMLDAAGSHVEDEAISMPLSELRGRVERLVMGERR